VEDWKNGGTIQGRVPFLDISNDFRNLRRLLELRRGNQKVDTARPPTASSANLSAALIVNTITLQRLIELIARRQNNHHYFTMTSLAAVILLAVAAVQPGLAFTSLRVQRPWVRGLRDNGDSGAMISQLHRRQLRRLHSTSASISFGEPSNPSSELATTADANRNAPPAAAKLPRKDILGRGAIAALLVLLVMQNAGASLLTSAVRKTTPYDGASVALMQEIGKVPLIFAAFFYFQSRGARRGSNSSVNSGGSDDSAASSAPPKKTLRGVLLETFSKSALDLAIPSACFAAQNVLYFTALRHLDAATYSLLSQSKTAFTAIFFVTVLGQRLAGLQIIALALLMSGMALVQLGPLWSASAATAATTTAVATTAASTTAATAAAASFALGSFAVLASSFSSGLANILFEKLVKFKGGSLYAKQLQLGLWTGAFTVAEILRRHGVGGLAWSALTQDWTVGVWGIVCLKSVGGLLVAATIR